MSTLTFGIRITFNLFSLSDSLKLFTENTGVNIEFRPEG